MTAIERALKDHNAGCLRCSKNPANPCPVGALLIGSGGEDPVEAYVRSLVIQLHSRKERSVEFQLDRCRSDPERYHLVQEDELARDVDAEISPPLDEQWHSDGSNNSWRVSRLVELAIPSAGVLADVEIASIRDVAEQILPWHPIESLQDFVEHTIRMIDADDKYPIILNADGRIMDGAHRIAKAMHNGLTTITAFRFNANPPPD